MQDITIIIRKYWEGTATQEEKALLTGLLSSGDPGLEKMFLEAYERDMREGHRPLSAERSDAVFQRVLEKRGTSRARVRTLRPWSVAAAAILVAAIGVLWLSRQGKRADHIQGSDSPVQLAQVVRQVSNTGQSEMGFRLKDRSLVRLLPGSSITYYEPFDSNKRDISLAGRAYFAVAKDPSRPFTVYAGDVATTAMGTTFLVNTEGPGKVAVRLFEGRVRVRAVGNTLLMPEVYLEPGQEIAVDRPLKTYAVTRFSTKENPSSEEATGETPALIFDHTALAYVLQQVGKKYHVHFSYKPSDIEGAHFTGTFLKTDSLRMLVSVICNMNGLAFTLDKNRIVIRKTP